MNPEQIVRQRIALQLGEMAINQIVLETERDALNAELAVLREQVKPQTDQPETGS